MLSTNPPVATVLLTLELSVWTAVCAVAWLVTEPLPVTLFDVLSCSRSELPLLASVYLSSTLAKKVIEPVVPLALPVSTESGPALARRPPTLNWMAVRPLASRAA